MFPWEWVGRRRGISSHHSFTLHTAHHPSLRGGGLTSPSPPVGTKDWKTEGCRVPGVHHRTTPPMLPLLLLLLLLLPSPVVASNEGRTDGFCERGGDESQLPKLVRIGTQTNLPQGCGTHRETPARQAGSRWFATSCGSPHHTVNALMILAMASWEGFDFFPPSTRSTHNAPL